MADPALVWIGLNVVREGLINSKCEELTFSNPSVSKVCRSKSRINQTFLSFQQPLAARVGMSWLFQFTSKRL